MHEVKRVRSRVTNQYCVVPKSVLDSKITKDSTTHACDASLEQHSVAFAAQFNFQNNREGRVVVAAPESENLPLCKLICL